MNYAVKRSFTKLMALVICLGVAQDAACAGKKAATKGYFEGLKKLSALELVEAGTAVASAPMGVLANNAEKSLNARTAHMVKIAEDLLVMANQGISIYNKKTAGAEYVDALHYKVLEMLCRGADVAKHVKAIVKKEVTEVQAEEDEVVTAMRKRLNVSAKALRSVIAPIATAAARTYVALNNDDTKEASKKRLMAESLAFTVNRLSDYIASSKGSLEADAQLVATMAGTIWMLADYNKEADKVKMNADKRAKKEAKEVADGAEGLKEKTVKNKAGKNVKVKRSTRKRAPVKYTA